MNTYKIKDSRFKELDLDTSQLGTTTNIENLNETVNQLSQDPKPANNIIVLAKRDNVTHNYFHYFELYWDARDCLSSIIIRMPKTDADNTKYWINYSGDIVLYMGPKNPDQQVTTDENNKSSTTSYWDLQGQKPIFQGEVTRVKEMKNELEIHVDSIGIRFKQKIPEEFRQSYINGQNVRDAFQAICEFLGVKYICPPPQEQTEPTTDGTENNVDKMQQTAQQITETVGNIAKQQSDQSDTETADQIPSDSGNTITDNPEVVTTLNGYTDVSFDANGAIVHGSSVLETGIDVTDTLLNLEEHPLDKYLPQDEYEEGQTYLNDERSFVVRDVRKLLNGEFFDTVHENVMNYGAITVEPASTTTSTPSAVGDVNGDGVVDEQDQEVAENSSGCGSGSLNKSQLWTELSKIVTEFYPASTNKNYWIGELRDASTDWAGIAKVINKMGGDKAKQNKVIGKVLCYKKRYKEMTTQSSSRSGQSSYQTGINKSHQTMYNIGKTAYNNRGQILNYLKGGH